MARILVLEDNPSIGMVIELALTGEGHQVELRKSALEGLSSMQMGMIPDLVLTDLIMGGMNGSELINKMRNNQQLCNIPAIIITGCIPNTENLPDAYKFQGLLIKPFDINELIDKVSKLISTTAA